MNPEIIELIINEENDFGGVEAVSIVEHPAIELDFVALKKENVLNKFAEVNKEQRILMGPALVPNKPILRRQNNEDFYVFFSKETVKKASQLFFIKGNQSRATIEHEVSLQGFTVVESWIVDDPEMDKSKKYGLDVPIGTWMISMKVQQDVIWEEFVKTGRVKGFSVEGYFEDKKQALKQTESEFIIEEMKAIFTDNPTASLRLPEAIIEQLKTLPESQMGVHIVDLHLKDKTVLNNRRIKYGKFLLLNPDENINVNQINKVSTVKG